MQDHAVMVHDGGEARVLDGSGTRISDLNAAFAAGATIEAAFPLPTSVALVLRWPMTRNVPDDPAVLRSGQSDGSAEGPSGKCPDCGSPRRMTPVGGSTGVKNAGPA